jgi:cytochrome c-type biogenesis protein
LAEAKALEIRLGSTWNRGRPSLRAASWDLPIALPPGASTDGLWSIALVLSLSAGLLSAVLTPCLLQLVVVFLAALVGVGDQGATRARDTKRIIAFAIWFVLGFTAVYTLAGALIGQLGHQSQLLFAAINRPAGIASGGAIILLALWTARASHVSVACRLPMPGVIDRIDRGGAVRAAATAVAFSVGCITCFGGAIVGTLLLYVGSVGSALVGAGIMLTFSAGVAIPFVAAALALMRAVNLGERLAGIRPWCGFASSVVMAAFGIVLITDNFHALSDWIYPYLHLPAQR